MHKLLGNRQSYLQSCLVYPMVSKSGSSQQVYYVLVSEWGTKTLVSVHAANVQSAEKIARQNAGRKDGWEGIHKVYHAFPMEHGA